MKFKILFIVLSALVVIGGGIYYWTSEYRHGSQVTSHESRPLYHCPMHPSYTSDKPGQCPICGMDLVPIEEEDTIPPIPPFPKGGEKALGRASVTISFDRQQLIGVKTDVVRKGQAIKNIRTAATAAFNPDLAVAQREYLESKKIGDASLTEAAKERLIILGMNEDEIKRLKNVQKGLYLQTNDSWIYPVVYEYELSDIKTGQEVMITLTGGKELKGVVRSIDSVIDQVTRTARLHVEVMNEKGNINPYAFGTANIKIDIGEQLLVKKSAVITTGERNIVFMVHEGTRFMPIDIKLGAELENDYVVSAGLAEGDTIVTSANFLIDSESKLKAAIGVGGEHKH